MPAKPKITPVVAGLVTAAVTTAAVLVARAVTDNTYSQISPLWAVIVGFVAPVYGVSTINKNRSRISSPRRATIVLSALVVTVVVITSLLGSQDGGYKAQMITQFVVLAACCVVLVPLAVDE